MTTPDSTARPPPGPRMRRGAGFPVPAMLVVLMAPLVSMFSMHSAEAADGAAHPAPSAKTEGAALYDDYCAVCHGDHGDGDSHARAGLTPPPRDFTSARARGELDRERMLAAVRDGVSGTAMAGWSSRLGEHQIAAVVDHVRSRFMGLSQEPMPGQRLYARNCSVCHGDDGAGAKWAGESLEPRPRNFRTADPGELTPSRMIEAVTHGRPGTAMVGFARKLENADIVAVVRYIRRRFMNQIDDGVALVAATGDGHDGGHGATARGPSGDAAAGGRFYAANCATCHGELGDGRGRRAYFIHPRPANFRDPAHRAHLDRDHLFEKISNGIRGREMPAWSKVLTPQQISDVVEYVYRTFIEPDGDG